MPSHEHDDVARETDPYSPSRSIARGRHRAPQLTAELPAAGGRYTTWTSGWTATRTTLAAVTTGTLAVGSVALAGCAPASQGTAGHDTSSINPATAPLAITPVTDAYSGQSDKTVALAVDAPITERASTGLLVGPGTMVAKPNVATDMHVLLADTSTHKGVANARVRILRQMPNHQWYTTRIVTTDGGGLASYTAKVLTTTRLTAVFDGTDTYTASHGNINTIDMYVPPKPKPAPVVTALTVTTPATTTASSGAGLQVTAPTTTTTTAPAGSSLGAKAVWLASQQAGKPYVWGGNGPYEFDCSGLTKYVYGQLGVTLPRTAEEQYEATTRVGQADRQVGDLIFFGTPGSIYHVGIYAGNNQIWNAPNSGSSVSLMTIWDSSYTVGRV